MAAFQAAAGGNATDIVRVAVFGALTAGYGAMASAAKEAMKAVAAVMTTLTGMISAS